VSWWLLASRSWSGKECADFIRGGHQGEGTITHFTLNNALEIVLRVVLLDEKKEFQVLSVMG